MHGRYYSSDTFSLVKCNIASLLTMLVLKRADEGISNEPLRILPRDFEIRQMRSLEQHLSSGGVAALDHPSSKNASNVRITFPLSSTSGKIASTFSDCPALHLSSET